MQMLNLTYKLTASCIAFVLLLGSGVPALAASGSVVGYVNRVLMSADDRWGGCMVLISVNPQSVVPTCSSWLTFSCSGDFTEPVQAYRMVDQAQLALAAGKQVQVWFQDDKIHNGYCFANRIDVHR